MEESNSEAVATHSKVSELTSALSKAQHDLSIAQKVNKRVLGELKTWKERALKLESNLKQEKRNNQKNITQLGFKMLQFENHLRKEQRDIESKFIDKENQIKALEDVISSLHSRIKKSSLCYNCFVVKHNSPERCASPDSYATKFPLDMDFSDHKPGNHGVLDTRSRSISLPLNLQSPIESPKANSELCFHHMLSPVPEELEISISEHAKRSFREPGTEECDTLEEEDELSESTKQTEETNEDKFELNGQIIKSQEGNSRNAIVERDGGSQETQLVTEKYKGDTILAFESEENDPAESKTILGDTEENMFDTDQNSAEKSYAGGNEIDVGDEKSTYDLVLPSNSKRIDREQYADKISDCQQTLYEDRHILNPEVHSVLSDIISRVEQLMEHRHNACADSMNANIKHRENCPDDTSGGISQIMSENTMQAADKEGSNRMPLSPKSEAIVAELKRAIFDASIELEKRHEVVGQAASSNLDRTVVNDVFKSSTNDSQHTENIKEDESGTIEENENGNDVRSNDIIANEVMPELNGDLTITKEDGILPGYSIENVEPELVKVDSSVSEQCVDTLTEYDVIELD